MYILVYIYTVQECLFVCEFVRWAQIASCHQRACSKSEVQSANIPSAAQHQLLPDAISPQVFQLYFYLIHYKHERQSSDLTHTHSVWCVPMYFALSNLLYGFHHQCTKSILYLHQVHMDGVCMFGFGGIFCNIHLEGVNINLSNVVYNDTETVALPRWAILRALRNNT